MKAYQQQQGTRPQRSAIDISSGLRDMQRDSSKTSATKQTE